MPLAILLEALDRLLQRNILAGRAGELRGDEERLREEALNLPGARYDELVLFAELVHAQNILAEWVCQLEFVQFGN